jgi:hypothetical protein
VLGYNNGVWYYTFFVTNKKARELDDDLREANAVRQGQSLTGVNDSTLGNLLQGGNFEKEVTYEDGTERDRSLRQGMEKDQPYLREGTGENAEYRPARNEGRLSATETGRLRDRLSEGTGEKVENRWMGWPMPKGLQREVS